jgi:hypothetical protein
MKAVISHKKIYCVDKDTAAHNIKKVEKKD